MKCIPAMHQRWQTLKAMRTIRLSHHASEKDMIDVSDAFLTNGFHHIQVASTIQARQLIMTFLNTVNYYHNAGYLGLDQWPENGEKMVDVYATLKMDGWLDHAPMRLPEFLCNHLYCDFLWVEATQELMAMDWFRIFDELLYEQQFDKVMPIVVFSYEKDF